MKIIFTQEEVKEALCFFIENEKGLGLHSEVLIQKPEVDITFRGSENQYTFIHGVEIEIKEKKDGE